MPKQFSYKFDAGPFEIEKELVGDWQVGIVAGWFSFIFSTNSNFF